ncbi:MAG: hypothetical protein IKB86_08755 [Clostridia bacterium]|nr:hypothetical protein [Clostridia bacterium]
MPRKARNEEEKGGSKIVTALLLVVIMALIGVLGYVLVETEIINFPQLTFTKAGAFEKALKENNYQAAATVFENSLSKEIELEKLNAHLQEYFDLCFSDTYEASVWTRYRGIEVFNEHIKEKVENKMDETVSRFYNNEFDETAAKTYLSRIAKFSFADEKLVYCVEQVEAKNASDTAYRKGVDLYNQEEFEQAVNELKKVSELDENRYPLAQTAIEACKNAWGTRELARAQEMVDAFNKNGAQELLEHLLEVFGEYPEAQEMLDSLKPVGEE